MPDPLKNDKSMCQNPFKNDKNILRNPLKNNNQYLKRVEEAENAGKEHHTDERGSWYY